MLPDGERNELTEWLAANRDTSRELATVFALSDFAADVAMRQPAALLDLMRSGAFRRPPPADLLGDAVEHAPDVDALKSMLRHRRNAVMLHIIWRDLNRHAQLSETTASVTRLADQFIDGALARLYEWAVEESGEPIGGDSGRPQRLVVIALGKLGAGELNLSSDVDLILAYPEPGTTRDGRRTNQQFFLKLSQRLIQVLATITTDGFVFRVDMRLRPYGDSGALVLHFDAIEQYYEEHGRDWERYAWIRARPCAGDRDAGQRLIESLRPFVFRRYLDFGAIQALRVMKARIDGERDRVAMRADIKLGPGGIREVEFIAQMRQLIWGGRQRALQCRGVVETLAVLAQTKLLPPEQARGLASAYQWLRNVEHRLQAIADQQTQMLPVTPLDQARIAYGMEYPDYASFVAALDVRRQHVSAAFDTLLAPESSTAPDAVNQRWHSLWLAGDLAALALELAAERYGASGEVNAALERLRAARDRPQVGEAGRTRLDALVPKLLVAAAATAHPELALTRVVPLLEATLRRSAYYMLLLENPAALATLVDICGASRWMADELSRYPALLDELLDPALLYTVPDIEALRADLRARLEIAGREGEEAELEALRAFKETHQFRVAACEVRGILKLMNVSDYLTYLAEVILEEALNLAWEQTARVHSAPPRSFAIIGFGKLGGLELGPGSDLDIVFVHALDIEHSAFLQRMVRRLLHLLTTRTHSGALYDVDTRLRPSGRDGTMVISLAAFERYQQEDAWAWEHQALVRARPVAGDAAVGAAFNRIRQDVLCRPRDLSALRAEIVDMRRRIGGATSTSVDLKREPGGIVDIEFMVQYLVLASASVHKSLAEWTDNVRILETAAAVGVIDAGTAALLKDAYLALRAERHREALDIPDDDRAREVLDRYGTLIREQWRVLLMPDIA
jgi:glutamate-ammonia-ligase adenylyltransferase